MPATCDGAEAKLGLCDVLIKHAQAPTGQRTARYGLFGTRTPEVKLILPRAPQASMKV